MMNSAKGCISACVLCRSVVMASVRLQAGKSEPLLLCAPYSALPPIYCFRAKPEQLERPSRTVPPLKRERLLVELNILIANTDLSRRRLVMFSPNVLYWRLLAVLAGQSRPANPGLSRCAKVVRRELTNLHYAAYQL